MNRDVARAAFSQDGFFSIAGHIAVPISHQWQILDLFLHVYTILDALEKLY